MTRRDRLALWAYAAWTALVVGASLARAGLSPDNLTRLATIAYLALGLGWYRLGPRRPEAPSGLRFVLRCSASALVVEACYMISRPVFPSLTVVPGMGAGQAVANTLLDFAFTLPAYLVIFTVAWQLLRRFEYGVAAYALLFSLGQALGDGNAFFLANPGALLLAPYVMLNYQAINVVPFLRVRERLAPARKGGWLRLVAPLVALPAAYWVTGALILVAGQRAGLR